MEKLTKILYAEDDPDIQVVVETIVQSLGGFEIEICENGVKLLEIVEKSKPQLILLDVMMPEMDGPTTYKFLQQNENTKNIPVIFMTAKAQVHEVDSYIKSGALGVITKPFDPLKLCDQIQELWDKQ